MRKTQTDAARRPEVRLTGIAARITQAALTWLFAD